MLGGMRNSYALARLSRELPPGKSIYNGRGDVRVDGQPVTSDTFVTPNSTIETGDDSLLIFAVGNDAFLLRSNSTLKLSGSGTQVEILNLITGRLLSVFGETRHSAITTVATLGIRGTGLYLEAEEHRTYACTCYGTVDISVNDNPDIRETVITTHHDAPRYIYADGDADKRIISAPIINHTDAELILIEELVGRVPPFGKQYNNERSR